MKKIINFTTLEENIFISKRKSGKPKSFVFKLIKVQQLLKEEVTAFTTTVAQKDTEIFALR